MAILGNYPRQVRHVILLLRRCLTPYTSAERLSARFSRTFAGLLRTIWWASHLRLGHCCRPRILRSRLPLLVCHTTTMVTLLCNYLFGRAS